MHASIQHWQDGPRVHVIHPEAPAECVGENGTYIGIAAPQTMHLQAVGKLLNHRHWRLRFCGLGFECEAVPHVA
jgi:hypothetical protein